MTDDEKKVMAEAIQILHKRFGGTEWTVEVGPPVYSPGDFRPFRKLRINGKPVEQLATTIQS